MHLLVTFERVFPFERHLTYGTDKRFRIAMYSFMIPKSRTSIETCFAHLHEQNRFDKFIPNFSHRIRMAFVQYASFDALRVPF